MKAFVFTDATLARHAGQFVWLDIDGEKATNARARKLLKIPAYPTLYVVDPASERVALRWVGGATVTQMHKLLDDGLAAVNGGGTDLDVLVAKADAFYAAGEDSGAAVVYQQALATAPADWKHYPRVMDATLFALSNSDGYARCVELSREAMERLKGTTSGANAAVSGLSCALSLPADDPSRKEAIALLEARCREAVADPTIALSTDDRSGIYLTLADAREDAKDEEGKKQVLSEDATLLEGAAAAAKTREQRAVFDPHRLSVYIELGQPERAIPMLEASEKDFPDDYNPPARLAIALNAMKKYDQALAASTRALSKAYGPRKLRLYSVRTDVYLGMRDTAAARQTIGDAIQHASSLPEDQVSPRTIDGLKKRLVTLGGAAAPGP